ncbi:MAG: hypothetical protein JW754_02085 [Candidatus Aenigmarchaeota archaeon]|nr:hypothetical protein [Candidatus Aenigmarchaeota archaeon]
MTTIIGIKAYGGKDHAVVMTGDFQATLTRFEEGGEAIYKRQEKSPQPYQKLMVDKDRELVLAITGTVETPATNRFIRLALNPDEGESKIDLKKKLASGYIPEFRAMNMGNCVFKNQYFEQKNQCEAMIGTRFDNEPRLFFVYPMGKTNDGTRKDMPESFYLSKGSGSRYAMEFLDRELDKKGIGVKSINVNDAIELASQALRESIGTDIYSSGMNLVVIDPMEIHEFGEQIRKASDDAVRKTINGIKNQFKE